MTTLVEQAPVPAEDLAPTALLDRVRRERQAAAAAEVEVLRLAVAWAHAHPELDDDGQPCSRERVDPHALAAHFAGFDPEEEIGGVSWAGLPRTDWRAGADFATACGMSTRAGEALMRDALILRHRLPATWRRVLDGEVVAWRARMVAQEVAGAPDDVVAAVDAVIAPRADRAGTVTVRRLIRESMIRLYPEEVELASLERLEARFVRLDREGIGHTGVTSMHVRGDYADLDDFDQALTALAHRLGEVDPEAEHESLEVRRARAVGLISNPGRAQALLDSESPGATESAGTTGRAGTAAPGEAAEAGKTAASRPARRSSTTLVLRIHDLALLGLDPVGHLEQVPAEASVVLADRVAAWCGREATDLTVLPVLDLAAHVTSTGYAVPEQLRRVVGQRDNHCLFPWCTRPAGSCDRDHVAPHGEGGRTCSCNLIPLCRRHHRLKTTAGYQPAVVEPGVVWWRTPHGHEFVVDRDGTLATHRARPDPYGCLHPSPG